MGIWNEKLYLAIRIFLTDSNIVIVTGWYIVTTKLSFFLLLQMAIYSSFFHTFLMLKKWRYNFLQISSYKFVEHKDAYIHVMLSQRYNRNAQRNANNLCLHDAMVSRRKLKRNWLAESPVCVLSRIF